MLFNRIILQDLVSPYLTEELKLKLGSVAKAGHMLNEEKKQKDKDFIRQLIENPNIKTELTVNRIKDGIKGIEKLCKDNPDILTLTIEPYYDVGWTTNRRKPYYRNGRKKNIRPRNEIII